MESCRQTFHALTVLCSHNMPSSALRRPAGSYSATSNNISWYIGRWWVVGLQQERTERGRNPPKPLLAVPNVTTHPSTASVPINILLYAGSLLCGFNLPVKGLIMLEMNSWRWLELCQSSYFVVRIFVHLQLSIRLNYSTRFGADLLE